MISLYSESSIWQRLWSNASLENTLQKRRKDFPQNPYSLSGQKNQRILPRIVPALRIGYSLFWKITIQLTRGVAMIPIKRSRPSTPFPSGTVKSLRWSSLTWLEADKAPIAVQKLSEKFRTSILSYCICHQTKLMSSTSPLSSRPVQWIPRGPSRNQSSPKQMARFLLRLKTCTLRAHKPLKTLIRSSKSMTNSNFLLGISLRSRKSRAYSTRLRKRRMLWLRRSRWSNSS